MSLSRREFVALGAGVGVSLLAGRALGARGGGAWSRAGEFFEWRTLSKQAVAAIGRTGDDLRIVGGNSVVLTDAGESLLIDTKQAVLGPALRREMKARAGTLRRVLNTHHHFDHAGGNGAFSGEAPIVAHPNAVRRIEASREAFLAQLDTKIDALRVSEVPGATEAADDARAFLDTLANLPGDALTPRERWSPEQKVLVGNLPVVVHHFGSGHTDNDLVVHVASENLVITGDLVFHGFHPFFDADGGADIFGWLRALQQVRMLCNERTVVVPGHGPVSDRGCIDRQMKYLTDVVAAVDRAIDAGKTRDEVAAMTLPGHDDYLLKFAQPFLWGGVFDQVSKAKAEEKKPKDEPKKDEPAKPKPAGA